MPIQGVQWGTNLSVWHHSHHPCQPIHRNLINSETWHTCFQSRFSVLTNSFSSHPFIGATRQRAGSEHDARHYHPDRDVRDPRRGRDIAPELRGRHVGSRRLRRRRQLDGGQVYSIEERNLHRGRHLRWIRVHLQRRNPGTHVRKGIRRDDVHGDHVVVHRHDAH